MIFRVGDLVSSRFGQSGVVVRVSTYWDDAEVRVLWAKDGTKFRPETWCALKQIDFIEVEIVEL